jgi:hypothetical protein
MEGQVAMWRKGRRLFSTAAVMMLLFSAAHTLGILAGVDHTREQKFDAFDHELRFAFWTLAFTVSVLLAALGVINLLVAASSADDALIGRLRWVNLAWLAGLIGVSAYYGITPPLITSIAIVIVLLASFF